ncbi:MAG: hypothetical protein COA49_06945 [Bacteroidetes bacterium]|nr:MAG: hypothetical protein COA49_06945 [Bacteroidota bacterium]
MKNLLTMSLVICLSFSISSCCDTPVDCCDNHTLVTVRDYTGLDGCGLVLETENGVLEAYNFAECGVIIEEGMVLCVDYDEVEAASICMVGPIVEVTYCELVE